ncbi:hypothetical protein ABE10_03045, partial [Bacillus toyonensis]|nr:hypothetical protein [Bacillus toyonensis]
EVTIMVGDLLQPLVRDPSPSSHVPEEGDHVVLAFRTAEAREQDAVVGDGHLDIRRARAGRFRGERHMRGRGAACF